MAVGFLVFRMALTRITSGGIEDGTITSADINSSAEFDIKFAAGAQDAPTINFTGATTSGLYSPGTDEVAISTAGTGRLFIDASGRVGIGRAVPGSTLDIESTTPTIRLRDSDAAESPYVEITGNNGSISLLADRSSSGTGGNIVFYGPGTTERLRITSTGAFQFIGAGEAGSSQAVSFSGTAPVNSLVINAQGEIGIGTDATTANIMRFEGTVSGATNGRGIQFNAQYSSDCTGNSIVFGAYPSLQDATFTANDFRLFNAGIQPVPDAVTLNILSAFNVNANIGDQATNVYGIESSIATGTGNNYNIYVDGTAPNYFAGKVGIGTTSASATTHIYEADTTAEASRMLELETASGGSLKVTATDKSSATPDWLIETTGDTVFGDGLDLQSIEAGETISTVTLYGETVPYFITWKPDGTQFYTGGAARDSIAEFVCSTPWDATTGTKRNEIYVGYEDASPLGVYITPDGFNLYMTGANAFVFRYIMSKAWDLSTASLKTNTDKRKLLGLYDFETTLMGLAFKTDGTRVFFIGQIGDRIESFDLATAWDVSTAIQSSHQDISISSLTSAPGGIAFKDDGTKVYLGTTTDLGTIYELDLGTAWDVTTVNTTPAGVLAGDSSRNNDFRDIWISSDGTRLYAADTSRNYYHGWTLSTAWDITTATLTDRYKPENPSTSNYGVFFKPDGRKFYSINTSTDSIYQYDLDIAFDFSSISKVKQQFIKPYSNSPVAIFFHPDGTSVYVADSSQESVFQIELETAWELDESGWDYLALRGADIASPSDIFVQLEGKKLYVSDATNGKIAQFALPTAFDLMGASHEKTYWTSTKNPTPQGINFSQNGKVLYTCDSGNDDIFKYSLGTAWDISTLKYEDQVELTPVDASFTSPQGLYVKYDNSAVWVVDSSADQIRKFNFNHSKIQVNNYVDLAAGAEVNGPLTVSDRIINRGNIETEKVISKNIELVDNLRADNVAINVQYSIDTAVSEAKQRYSDFDYVDLEDDTADTRGVFIDGTKMYVLDNTNSSIRQYAITDNNVKNATLVRSLDISGETLFASSISFSPTGDKMLVGSKDNQTGIFLYNLSTAWDISTATCSLSTASQISFDVSSEITTPGGMYISSNGEHVYVIDEDNNLVQKYNLATGFNFSTATAGSTYSFDEALNDPRSLHVDALGEVMYVTSKRGEIFQFSMSTAHDVTTLSYDAGSRVVATNSAFDGDVEGLTFGDSGTKLYCVDAVDDTIHQLNLSTPYDVSTISSTQTFNLNSNIGLIGSYSLSFSSDGTKLFVADPSLDVIVQLDLSTAWDISTISFSPSLSEIDKSADFSNSTFTGFKIKGDGTRLYIFEYDSQTVKRYNLSTAWDITTAGSVQDSFTFADLDIKNITLNNDCDKLYALDQTSTAVRQYSVETAGTLTGVSFSTQYILDNTVNGADSTTVIQGDLTDLKIADDGLNLTISANDQTAYSYLLNYTLTTANDVSTAYYRNAEATSTTYADDRSHLYSPTGMYLYFLNLHGNLIQYVLQAPYTSATGTTVNQVPTKIFKNELGRSIELSNDGTRIYVLYGSGSIVQFDLDIKYRLESIVTSKALPAYYYAPSVRTATLSSDGTKIFFGGDSSDRVFSFNLSTAWDLDTASPSDVLVATDVGNIRFNSDGTRLYLSKTASLDIQQYGLSTAYDLTTASTVGRRIRLAGSLSKSASGYTSFDISGSTADTRFYTAGEGEVRQYTITTAGDLNTLDRGDYFQPEELDYEGITGIVANSTNLIISTTNDLHSYTITSGDINTAVHANSQVLNANLNIGGIDSYDGSSLIVADSSGELVQFAMTTDWDLSTLNLAATGYFNNALRTRAVQGLNISNTNGITIYTIDDTNRSINVLPLSTGNDISSISHPDFCDAFNLFVDAATGYEGYVEGARWGDSGNKLYVALWRNAASSSTSGRLLQFNLATPYTIPDAISRREASDTPNYIFGTTHDQDKSFDTECGVDAPRSFDFNSDGTRVYVTGSYRDYLASAPLTTAWDISTLSGIGGLRKYFGRFFIDSANDNALQSNTQNTTALFYNSANNTLVVGSTSLIVQIPFRTGDDLKDLDQGQLYHSEIGSAIRTVYGFRFSPDGLNLYAVDSQDRVVQHTLTTAWDLTTASETNSILATNVGTPSETAPVAVHFNRLGTIFYVIGQTADKIQRWNLSTPWDISTATYHSQSPTFDFLGVPQDFWIRDNGTDFYLTDYLNNRLVHYTLSTAWDVTSTITKVEEIVALDADYDVRSINFKPDGLRFYTMGSSQKYMAEWICDEPFKLTNAYINKRLRLEAAYGNQAGFDFDAYGSKLFINHGGLGIARFSLDGERAKRLTIDGKLYINGDLDVSNNIRVGRNVTVVDTVTELSDTGAGAGLFTSYAIIADQKPAGTDGGTFTNGAWRTRDLNTEISDADDIVALASNQFTLGAGNYLIRWQCPALRIERHISRLQDITNTATVATGSSSYSDSTTSLANSVSFGAARVSITGNTVYEVQNICFISEANIGFGLACNLDSTNETYTIVEIFKEA